MIDDGIYNRIIETEAKNEIKEMNRNYSNVDKNFGELNTFTSIIFITKITLDMGMFRPFHNKSSVIAS